MNQSGIFPQKIKQQTGADSICNDCCCGDTVNRSVQNKNEKQVQGNIGDAGNNQADQRRSRISLTSENGGGKVVKQNHRHAKEIDTEIQGCHRQNIVRNGKQQKQLSRDQLAEDGKTDTADQRNHDRGMYGFFDILPAVLAGKFCNDDIRAERYTDKKGDKKTDNRAVASDGGHSLLTDKTPDYGNVSGIEQLLKNSRQSKRQDKDNNFIS